MRKAWSIARGTFFGLVAVTLANPSPSADAGHEAAIYPSYYPQEIRIDVVPPNAAQEALERGDIHAYLGTAAEWTDTKPHIAFVESLGSYVLVTTETAQDPDVTCTRMDAVVGALSEAAPGFVFHPYPVTDHHADYLHHFDLATAAKAQARRAATRDGTPNLKGADPVTQAWLDARWPRRGSGEVVKIKLIDVAKLLAEHGYHLNGWTGPPWLKSGWFHAYLLLRDGVGDPQARRKIDALIRRLQSDGFSTKQERINAERDAVSLLTAQCQVTIAGYITRRQAYNMEYSSGVENVAYDSLTGLNSAIFLRTVKLKDFPWNGWLRLGVNGRPEAAWNPIAGFTDPAGRLIWHGIGDPALLAEPYGATWFGNRIADIKINPKP